MTYAGVLFVVLIAGLPTVSNSTEPALGQEGNQSGMVVTGTLQELDLTRMKGMLKTDLGKPIFFQVVKPHLFERLSVGEKVTIQLDQDGRATKVIDMPVPELRQPLQPQ
ncbi:MAG TPA: hypothetical protein VJV04_03000 [Nitrospiraceae bacterium]|nr:hypothetical protein [Nitrospiraceae bacterium]